MAVRPGLPHVGRQGRFPAPRSAALPGGGGGAPCAAAAAPLGAPSPPRTLPAARRPAAKAAAGQGSSGGIVGARAALSLLAGGCAAARLAAPGLRHRHRGAASIARRVVARPRGGGSGAAVADSVTAAVVRGGGGGEEEGRAGSAPAAGWLNEVTGPLLLLLLAVLYGGNVPLLKLIETDSSLNITAPELLLLRFVSAAALVVPWVCFNAGAVLNALLPAVELAFYLWIGYVLQLVGLEKTSAVVTSVAFASVGLIVQALEFLFDRQAPSPRVAGFSLGTVAGIALFVTSPEGHTDAPAPENPFVKSLLKFFGFFAPAKLPHETWLAGVPGEALVLGGAFFFAVHVWRCNKIVQGRSQPAKGGEQGAPASSDNFTFALGATQCILVACFCAVLAYFDSPYSTVEAQVAVLERLGATLWPQILACGMLCTGLPAVVELFAFEVVSPEIASLIYCTIPLWGTVLGVICLKETLGTQSIVAGIIILCCSLAPSILQMLDGPAEGAEAPKSSEEDMKDQVPAASFDWATVSSAALPEVAVASTLCQCLVEEAEKA